MKRILFAALLAGAALTAAQAPAAAPFQARDDTQTLIFLGDGGPVVVRLHLRLDERSFRAAWRDFMDRLFDSLDVNRDGVLSKQEAAAAPPVAALLGQGGFGGPSGGDLDANRDGKVSRTELADFYRRTGLAPFQIGPRGPGNDGFIRLNTFTGGMGGRATSAVSLNARLFKLLDTDGDGKLSRKELAAAPAVLGKLDRDEDEMITPDELMGDDSPRRSGDDLVALAFLSMNGGQGDRPFHLVADGRRDRELAKRLLTRYGKKGARKVEAKALGLDRNALARLDRDGDGWLDEEELAHFGMVPADMELTVRLGKRAAREPIVEVHKKGRRGMKTEATATGVTVTVGTVRLELRGPQTSNPRFLIDVRQQYIAQFKAADTDNNGYLDRKEAERNGLFRNLFAVMDRDGDGKLFEEEMLAYLDQMAKLRELATRSCLSLSISDQGKGLFEMADTDGDGRLGIRELRNLAKLIDQLDQDGDGLLAPNEVPRHYRGTFERGGVARGSQVSRQVIFLASGRLQARPLPARTRGPLWFRKMDLNRDGDVSRKEWLGTEKEFQKIDTDGDGLISVEEAEAYDRRKRAEKSPK